MVSPRKSRRKSPCFSSTTTSMPARASSSPSIIPAGPPPTMQQRVSMRIGKKKVVCRVGQRGTTQVPHVTRRCVSRTRGRGVCLLHRSDYITSEKRMKPVRKAVFPVAGRGTRFLPATKAMPKEMLPIVDKPLIQYAVEEAVASGITDLIFVTGRNKRAIEDHFDSAPELENELAAKNKSELLDAMQSILPSHVSISYVRQA